jgi:hypothetical protein
MLLYGTVGLFLLSKYLVLMINSSDPNVSVPPSHSPATIAFSFHFAFLTVDNKIGDAGAAGVASALEPRRNGDGSWTPSTALTGLNLHGEWALLLMVVTEKE